MYKSSKIIFLILQFGLSVKGDEGGKTRFHILKPFWRIFDKEAIFSALSECTVVWRSLVISDFMEQPKILLL